jgi:hypothetical protein
VKGDRQEVATAFEAFAEHSGGSGVVLVHAGFGMGKTFFVENWRDSLRARGRPVVHFDTWRNDYLESPLAGFISSLADQLPNNGNLGAVVNGSGTAERIQDFAKAAAPVLLKTGVRVGTRLLSLGVLDGDVDTVKEIILSEGIAATEDAATKAAEAFSRTTSQRTLHEALATRFSEIVQSTKSAEAQSPLIILIDELDRCRPDFAFNLLEDIKHFLGVEGVMFFIFCDEEVLQAQAAKIFGDKHSGEKYISKFYTQRLRLPRTGARTLAQARLKLEESDSGMADFAGQLCEATATTLRQSETIASFLEVLFGVKPKMKRIWPVSVFLSVLREKHPESYRHVLQGERIELNDQFRDFIHQDALARAVWTFLTYSGDFDEMTELQMGSDSDIRQHLRDILRGIDWVWHRDAHVLRSKLFDELEFVAGIR